MLSRIHPQKISGIIGGAVLIATLLVGLSTMKHGDVSLGLLVLLGKIQELLGYHNSHASRNELAHLVVHNKSQQ